MQQALVRFIKLGSQPRRHVLAAGSRSQAVRVAALLDVRAAFNWWEAWGEIKIEGFGGRPGALGPMPP